VVEPAIAVPRVGFDEPTTRQARFWARRSFARRNVPLTEAAASVLKRRLAEARGPHVFRIVTAPISPLPAFKRLMNGL